MYISKPVRLYLGVRGGLALIEGMFFFLLALYYVQTAGMNPLQLVLTGTAMEAAILLFEIPTGVVADTYSRKLSVVIGIALSGLCFMVEGFVPVTGIIILLEFIRGIGETFISGAFTAWITDEIGEEKVGPVLLRAGQIGQLCGIAGTGGGVLLAIAVPIGTIISLGAAGLLFMAGFMLVALPEKGFKKAPAGTGRAWLAMGATLKTGLRVAYVRPLAMTIVAVGFVYGAYSEGYDRLWEAHLLKDFEVPLVAPVIWFGLLSILPQITNFFLLEVIIRRVKTGNVRSVLVASIISNSLLVLSLLVFALAGNFYLAVLACWSISTVRYTGLYEIWVNRNLDPAVRATVLSFSSQLDAVGQLLGGPLVGFIGAAVSIPAALFTSALMLSPVILLYANALRLNRKAGGDEMSAATTAEG